MNLKVLLVSLTVILGGLSSAFANPNNLTIQLNNGQTAEIQWSADTLQSGPGADNPFVMTVWNTRVGPRHLEDLQGVTASADGIADFFKISMTDMDMPDPAQTYKSPRMIVRTTQGTYNVKDVFFSMSSMSNNDWEISILVNGVTLGSGTVTVQ